MVAGDAFHQLVDDPAEAFIFPGRVDQQPPENDLASGIQLAFLGVLSGEQSLISGLSLFDLLSGFFDGRHFLFPAIKEISEARNIGNATTHPMVTARAIPPPRNAMDMPLKLGVLFMAITLATIVVRAHFSIVPMRASGTFLP